MNTPAVPFQVLAARLGLSETVTSLSTQLFHAFCQIEGFPVQPSTEFAYRCAILAASRLAALGTREGSISLAQVLSDLDGVDMHSFLVCLKKFSEKVPMEAKVKGELSAIKTGFTFAYTFYRKFEEIWGSLEVGEGLSRQICWLLFLVCKADFLCKRTEVVDCSFILIAALHFTLTRFPLKCSKPCFQADSEGLLEQLASFLKTQARYTVPYLEKVVVKVRGLIQQRWVLRSGTDLEQLSDMFLREEKNQEIVNDLSQYYQRQLRAEDTDEREFLTPGKIRMNSGKDRGTLTPVVRLASPLPPWDHLSLSPISIQAQLPCTPLTPMTQAMELNNWLANATENIDAIALNEALIDFCRMCESDPEPMIVAALEKWNASLEKLFIKKRIGLLTDPQTETFQANPKVSLVLKLYLHLLELMLQNESRKNASANFSLILHNQSFHSSLLASSLETVLYLHNICVVSFEEVLSVCRVTAFDFWKIITTYCNVDSRMPMQVKAHFRTIEIRIISTLGWTSTSPVLRAIKGFKTHQTVSAPKADSLHMTYDLFFRRVLSFTAYRVFSVTEELRLTEAVREEIWALLKFLLSEHTELMVDRHLDQIILCAIFGVCKARGPALKFMTLARVYSFFNPEEEEVVTRQARLADSQGTLLDFFNQEILPLIREFTQEVRRPEAVRLLSFSPDHSLRASVSTQFLHLSERYAQSPSLAKSPFHSPYMTPVTQRLFATPQSHPSDKHLDFEREELKYAPCKKPKHLQDILTTCKEELVLPQLSQ